MNELEVLRAARKRISDPKDWWSGKSKCGNRLRSVCVGLALADLRTEEGRSCAEQLVLEQIGKDRLLELYEWNDSHTHAEVLALLDDVIARLEEHELGGPLPAVEVAATDLVVV